jgi:uncharacterized DUF497 family protein
MDFEWDERKARLNLERHGIDFRRASTVFDAATSFSEKVREKTRCAGSRRPDWARTCGRSSTLVAATTSGSYRHGEREAMKRKGTIVRYSAEEINEMLARGEDRTDWQRLHNMTEEEIERNALEDNRRHGIPDDWYEDAVLSKGPPAEPKKTPR